MKPLASHDRFPYSAIVARRDYSWPDGARLAFYIGFNVEHFAFGEGLGALVNTSIYDHCPEVIAAFVKRGDELIAHGHTNSERQGTMAEDEERALVAGCKARMEAASGVKVDGWLSPWISESFSTPDLLKASGYRYTLNWCHDDQPIEMQTQHGALWSIPYPQEMNDIPMIVARQLEGREFADIIVEQFDEMREQSRAQPLVMGLALHPYIVGQPHRLRHLRRALQHVKAHATDVWFTTPGAICDHMEGT